MDKKTIYIKTAKGENEGPRLPGDLKRLLGFIDAKSSSDELAKRAPPSLRNNWKKLVGELLAGNYIVGIDKPSKGSAFQVTPKETPASTPAASTMASVEDKSSPDVSALSPAELEAKEKDEKAARARSELKAFFATAKVKAEAEAKAAREEEKIRHEDEEVARVRAEAEAKALHDAVLSEQAKAASKAAGTKAKQKADETVAAAKTKADADMKAKADAKAKKEVENVARLKAEAEVKAQQEASQQAKVVQAAADPEAKRKAEVARVRAELEAAVAANKVRADAELKSKADALVRREAEKLARAKAETEVRDHQGAMVREKAETGMPQLSAKQELNDAGSYNWLSKSGSMDESVARRLRDLENENNNLKRLLAEAYLDLEALKITFGVKR